MEGELEGAVGGMRAKGKQITWENDEGTQNALT